MNKRQKEVINGIFRSGITAIPYAGGLLNEVLFDIRSRIHQNRLNSFTESFIKYVELLGIEINEEVITTNEFNDIYFSILKHVIKTDCEDKLRIFRDILVSNTQEIYTSNFTETFLELVSKLDFIEIEILKMYKSTGRGGSIDTWHKSACSLSCITSKSCVEEVKNSIVKHFPQLSTFQIEGKYEFYMWDLISKSLLRDSKDTNSSLDNIKKEPLTVLYLTEFGKEFLRFIECSEARKIFSSND